MLSYPWPSPKESPFYFGAPPRDGSVGDRVKTMLCNTYAYQRLPHSEIANKALAILQAFPIPRAFPWAIPDKVAVIYNMAFGPQKCKDVEGFPNVKRDGLSCPLAPGESSSSSSASSTAYLTDAPTQYLPSTWTGFETATGDLSTPSGVFITASFTETIIVPLPTTTSYATTLTVILTTTTETSSTLPPTTTTQTVTTTTCPATPTCICNEDGCDRCSPDCCGSGTCRF